MDDVTQWYYGGATTRAGLTDKVKHDSGRENIWRNLKRLNNS